MNLNRPGFRKIGQTLIPWGYLEGVRLLAGGGFSWERSLACWLLIGGAMLLGWSQPPRFDGKRKGTALWVRPGLTVLTGAAAWVAGRTESLYWAGLTLVLFYGLLAGWEKGLFPRRAAWRKWGTRLVLSLLGGMLPVLYNQVEIRFSEEEFFAVLQVLVLSGFTLLLILSAGTVKSSEPGFPSPGGRPGRAGERELAFLFYWWFCYSWPSAPINKVFILGKRLPSREYLPPSRLSADQCPPTPNPSKARRCFSKW